MGGDKDLTVHPRPNIDGVASYKTDISFMNLNFRQREPVREEEASGLDLMLLSFWCGISIFCLVFNLAT